MTPPGREAESEIWDIELGKELADHAPEESSLIETKSGTVVLDCRAICLPDPVAARSSGRSVLPCNSLVPQEDTSALVAACDVHSSPTTLAPSDSASRCLAPTQTHPNSSSNFISKYFPAPQGPKTAIMPAISAGLTHSEASSLDRSISNQEPAAPPAAFLTKPDHLDCDTLSKNGELLPSCLSCPNSLELALKGYEGDPYTAYSQDSLGDSQYDPEAWTPRPPPSRPLSAAPPDFDYFEPYEGPDIEDDYEYYLDYAPSDGGIWDQNEDALDIAMEWELDAADEDYGLYFQHDDGDFEQADSPSTFEPEYLHWDHGEMELEDFPNYSRSEVCT